MSAPLQQLLSRQGFWSLLGMFRGAGQAQLSDPTVGALGNLAHAVCSSRHSHQCPRVVVLFTPGGLVGGGRIIAGAPAIIAAIRAAAVAATKIKHREVFIVGAGLYSGRAHESGLAWLSYLVTCMITHGTIKSLTEQ